MISLYSYKNCQHVCRTFFFIHFCKCILQMNVCVCSAGEKPYACDECDYRTNRADALRAHRDTQHCDMRPYVCEKMRQSIQDQFSSSRRTSGSTVTPGPSRAGCATRPSAGRRASGTTTSLTPSSSRSAVATAPTEPSRSSRWSSICEDTTRGCRWSRGW